MLCIPCFGYVTEKERLQIIADYLYDKDNYTGCYPIYLKICNSYSFLDGQTLYRLYYSYKQLYGMNDKTISYLKRAYNTLSKESPKTKYYTYAKNALSKYDIAPEKKSKPYSSSLSKDYKYNISEPQKKVSPPLNYKSYNMAENGDIYGADNDGDGRREYIYVHGYYRKDGTYVRGHYRAAPRR